MYRAIKMNTSQKGSILILTLIVMTFLSALALQLGHFMRSKNTMIRNYQNDIISLQMARGAVNKVISEIERDKIENTFDYLDEGWMKKFMRDENAPRIYEWKDADNRTVGKYTVRVADESGKININVATLNNLKLLLNTFEGIDGTELAQNIVSYRDTRGANKAFYSIHELLLLDGMEKDVFLGEDANENGYMDTLEEKRGFVPEVDHYDKSVKLGFKDYVTVFTNGKINLNTAPLSVLLSMPGISRDIADDLIDRRKQKPFALLDDIKNITSISKPTFAKIARWASVQSGWYKIVVSANIEGSDRNKVIVAIIDRSGDRSKIKYWREN